jgi:Rrf2 family protein
LKRHGIVRSRRGRGGGFALAKPADVITIGRVVRLMDGPLAPLPCVSVNFYQRCTDCTDEADCEIRKVMRRVREAVEGAPTPLERDRRRSMSRRRESRGKNKDLERDG